MSAVPPTEAELQARYEHIDGWLQRRLDEQVVDTVERDVHQPRAWFVRMLGDEKEFITVWMQLRQRRLHAETYFMPAPEENHAELFAYLLRRNARIQAGKFVIGAEEAVYIHCHVDNDVPLERLDDELDRVVGSIYQWVEQFFKPALRIGFASRFARSDDSLSGREQT